MQRLIVRRYPRWSISQLDLQILVMRLFRVALATEKMGLDNDVSESDRDADSDYDSDSDCYI